MSKNPFTLLSQAERVKILQNHFEKDFETCEKSADFIIDLETNEKSTYSEILADYKILRKALAERVEEYQEMIKWFDYNISDLEELANDQEN